MPDIVLATLNARFIHCAFGLRYLFANMGELQSETALLEFTISQPTLEILDAILAQNPRIVGLGVYIWNVEETTRLVADLKRVRPEIVVVLGGPEVSYETEDLAIVQLADHVIAGEADLAFVQFCRERKSLETNSSRRKAGEKGISTAPLPVLTELILPYDFYTDEDIAHRVIYVEASRGCPFTCEFCLSALDILVRQFPLDPFLAAIDSMLQRGARQFKFVDRTFNLNLRVGRAILEFFLERYQPGLFLHFEMIPDRLPEALKDLIVRFPAGALQFEVGIQTFNERVCELISRHQDNDLAEQNLRWLHFNTGVHVHADLIVGLPGESIESFAAGFNRLVKLNPHEIQVGILKRLRGTPIIRHDVEWQMVYSPHPPYEILSNKLLDYFAIQELRRFAKFWDALANSGNFVETLSLFWMDSQQGPQVHIDSLSSRSPFHEFRKLSNWLFQQEQKTHGIPLGRLVELVLQYGTEIRQLSAVDVAEALWRDYQRGGRSDKPHCLRPYIETITASSRKPREIEGPKRQARHQPN
jgi:radical SAM superfamily enzyme YgiQ (UPF0313 family)